MPDNEYTSGLNILLGNQAAAQDVQTQSPAQDILDVYDSGMQGESSGLGQMLQGVNQVPAENTALDRYALGQAAGDMGADQYGKLDELQYGSAPDQQIADPTSMIGSTGQRVERGLKAGWGDLLYGSGETVDFINAWARPGDPEPSTSVGDWFKKIGTEYQNENTLILSEELQDITFQDMFKGEFWSSKISRLVPYALSFMIPYTGGAKLGAFALGRFGIWSAKSLKGAKGVGKMGKGLGMGDKGIKGTGVMGKLAFDAGKKGLASTKFMRNTGGFVGGGLAANLAEGAYLSGEAYTQMLHETDENGNKLFSPDEAASHAAGVMTDNAKWAVVDMVQYGILFGGMGKSMAKRLLINPLQKTPFKASIGGLTAFAARKVLPNMPAAGVYASIEGITEGIQETYQEWIKYANIQEAKGEEYQAMTDWVKDDYGNYKPEIRDIFWSSVGLGSAMGGSRGYYDAVAERKKAIDENIDALNNNARLLDEAQTPDQQYIAEQYVQDNIIASNVWNYGGDGSIVVEYINNMVKDKKMSQETADEYIQAVEEAEKNYKKHSTNSMLTESGARQAFFRETRIARNLQYQTLQEASHENDKAVIKENIKDDKKQQKALARAEENHLSIMETLKDDQVVLEKEIEDIYTLRTDKAPIAKKTGKRDARFKVQGLTKEEMTEYSQAEAKKAEAEAEKKAEEAPSLVEQVKEVGTKALKGAKELGGKAVEGVKGLFGKAKEKAQSPETKEAIKKVKDYTKNEITPTAKEYLIKLLEAGKIAASTVATIVGTGINKIINRGDVDKAVKKEERDESKEKSEEKSEKT